MDVRVSAEIATMGFGTQPYEADRKRRLFIVHMHGELRNGLHDVNTYRVEEYDHTEFEKEGALESYLIPHIYADDLEDEAEKFIEKYCYDAIYDMWQLPIGNIMQKMKIDAYEAPLPDTVFGRMYFKKSKAKVHIKFHPRYPKSLSEKEILPGTMLISEDVQFMNNVGSGLNTIAHELIHWDKHQKFFEILSLLNDDAEMLSCEVTPEGSDVNLTGIQRALWWVEWQANALAPRILMPRSIFVEVLEKVYGEQSQTPYFYVGEIMERAIEKIAVLFGVSRIAAKIRAIQLGYDIAEGTHLFIDGHYRYPFSFPIGTLGENKTFIIDRKNYESQVAQNGLLSKLVKTGKVVYTGCVVCINDPFYVRKLTDRFIGAEYELTDYALEHVNECCIKFRKKFTIDRANDGGFYGQCFLCKDINASAFCETLDIDEDDNQNVQFQEEELRKLVIECERITEFCDKLPLSFYGTLDAHMKRLTKKDGRKMTNEELHFRTGISERYIQDSRKKYVNISREFVYGICIGLHLHPIFSADLIRKAYADYTLTPEGAFARFLINNHFMDSLKLCNTRLKKAGYPTWGNDKGIVD